MQTTVLGLGNLLYGDEGLGVRLAERLDRHYDFIPQLTIVDGGTRGFALLPYIEQAENLLIMDAVDMNLAPGELIFLENEAVPRWLAARKFSLHQTSFAELLALAAFRETLPPRIILIGVQPKTLNYGAPLSPVVEDRLPALEALCLRLLRALGHRSQPARTKHPSLPAPCLSLGETLPALRITATLRPFTMPSVPACLPPFVPSDGV